MQRAPKSHRRPARFGSRLNTTSLLNTIPLTRLAAGGVLSLMATWPLSASAQTPPPTGKMPNLPMPTSGAIRSGQPGLALNISAESTPYHLDWNGTSGTLTRRALGGQAEIKLPLTFLHSEPGPKGYSKYLAWFLARDRDHFSIAWCYLNDGGREFYCWLYQFPTNQLTTLRFTGDYRFAPLPEPVAPSPMPDFAAQAMPTYTGPDFKYRDWTRRSGQLATLDLKPARESFAASLAGEGEGTGDRGQGTGQPAANNQPPTATKTLTGLRVYPLHEIQVAKGNGWRAGGWRELHALAMDSANEPYYLIMYSNVTQGYAVDIKRAQTYVVDFGSKVDFSNDNTVFGAKEETIVGPPDARIRRYSRVEIPLVTTNKYDNPYNNVQLYMEFRTPDGKTVSVPGFWDGGQTWRVRFTPTQVGKWSWRSYSNDTNLEKQVGSFTCVSDDSGGKGFVTVNAQRFYPHSFASANGLAFFPVYLRDPVHYFPAPDVSASPTPAPKTPAKAPANVSLIVPMQDTRMPASMPQADGIDDPALLDLTTKNTPRTFTNFARRVDDAAALGFNRFWGGWLLDPALFPKHAQENEGGAPFVNYDLDNINPSYFQWMDRRIAYCNERGIVPDVGITDIGSNLLSEVKPEQISRLWQYTLARYSSFNVNWNLFGKSPDNPYPPDVDAWVEPLGKMTDLYDPAGHPLTTVVPNFAPQIPVTPPSTAPVIIRPDNPVIIRPDAPNANGFVPDFGNSNPFTPNQPGSNPAGGTPSQPFTGGRGTGAPGTQNPADASGATDPNASGNNGRRGRNQQGNNGRGNNSGDNSANTNGRGNTGRGTTSSGSAGGTNSGSNGRGSTGRGSNNNSVGQTPTRGAGNMPGRGTGAGSQANGAGGQTPNFPGLPNSGSGFPGRSATGGGGTGQDMTGADPRFQGRTGRTGRGGRGRGGSGFGGSGSGLGGTFGSGSEITGNTTQFDYVTIVDPQVAASMRSDRQAQRPTGAPVSVPIVRYASDAWLDVVTLAGGDLTALSSDYRLNKPLVVQDVTGKDPSDAARHRMWETIMRGGFWQGAVTANTGVADPLNSPLARWQLAAARLMQKTQYTRLLPHQDMLGGLEESAFDRRRRKRAQAEAASATAPAMPTSPTMPDAGTSGAANPLNTPTSPNVPGRSNPAAGTNAPAGMGAPGARNTPNTTPPPFSGFSGDVDDNGDPVFNFSAQPPAVAKKPTPGAIYVLADPGWEYVVYFSSGGSVTLDLLEASSTLRQSWFNPRTGEYASQDTIKGGVYKTFTAPDANDWVLMLSRR